VDWAKAPVAARAAKALTVFAQQTQLIWIFREN
jgi:hypothetical protein